MRLCLFAFIGSDNLGDEAIFEVVYHSLQSLRPERLTILSMNPARTRRIATAPNVRVLQALSTVDTARAIGSCDLLVVGGGGMFQDHSSIYNPLRFLSRVHVARLLRKPVFVYGVSAGPLNNRVNRRMAGRVLGRADRITVRDSGSRRELISLGVPAENVTVTSDPVINFPTATVVSPTSGSGWRNIVVCLRHWFDVVNWLPVSVVNALHIRTRANAHNYNRFIFGMAQAFDFLLEDPAASITCVPFWGGRDTLVHDDVVRRMRNAARCRVLRQSPSATEANALLAKADLVLGMRLHSLIFAVANARPFFAIDYSKKVGDFIEEVLPGKSGLVSVSPVDLDAAALLEKLRGLKANSPFDREYVASVEQLKERERGNLVLLRSFLEERGLSKADGAGFSGTNRREVVPEPARQAAGR